MRLNIFKRRKKIYGYQNVKSQVSKWLEVGEDAEVNGLRNVSKGVWHELDLYQALIALNTGSAKLIAHYGRKYQKSGGNNVEILHVVNGKGASFSVKGALEYIANNGVKNALRVYSIASLSSHENGLNIAKAIYSELATKDVNLALPYGLWTALSSDDSAFIQHVIKRLTWQSKSKDISVVFSDILEVVGKKESITLFLEPLIFNGDKLLAEKFIRLNFDFLDSAELSAMFIKHGVAEEYYGIVKKLAAGLWSNKDYKQAALLYMNLLVIKQEEVIAERYYLASSNAELEIDTQLQMVSEIKNGYEKILRAPNEYNDKHWFELYPNVARKAIDAVVHSGLLQNAVSLCERLGFDHPKVAHWQDLINIAKNGLPVPDRSFTTKPYNQKISYLLYNSLPVHSGGYATRSHGIISNLMQQGIQPYVMTRLGYPYDLNKFKGREVITEESYEGITYHRLLNGPGLNFVPVIEYLTAYKEEVKSRLEKNNSSVVHAASNHINGISAVLAGRELGLKTIFEVRGMWEVTRMSRQPDWEGTVEFDAYRYLETLACEKADVVITITQALKGELASRGIPEEKIHVIPNGVDTTIFKPMPAIMPLKEKVGIPAENVVIGYVGSIVDYEGLDLLVESVQEMVNNKVTGFTVLIVGDGVVLPQLQQQVSDAGLDQYFIFTGRVPHEDVPDYYSFIDVCPFPRRGLPVCELVSPLKPFEAMAMGKVIIGSSVKAIAEFIDEGENGFVHEKDNVQDLASKLTKAITDTELRETIKATSRRWAVERRDWKVLSSKVYEIYETLR